MVIKSLRSVRKGKGDYGWNDSWKRQVLGLEWNRDGVMHSESSDDDGDNDELVRKR